MALRVSRPFFLRASNIELSLGNLLSFYSSQARLFSTRHQRNRSSDPHNKSIHCVMPPKRRGNTAQQPTSSTNHSPSTTDESPSWDRSKLRLGSFLLSLDAWLIEQNAEYQTLIEQGYVMQGQGKVAVVNTDHSELIAKSVPPRLRHVREPIRPRRIGAHHTDERRPR